MIDWLITKFSWTRCQKDSKNVIIPSDVTGLKPGQVRFQDFRTYNDMDWEKISMAALLHLWKLILNCVWNINETCALIKKIPWSLPLPESMVQLLHFSLSVFYKDHNKECLLTKYEQFSKCCFRKISGQCSKYLLIHRIKGILSGLTQLLATESPLKMMKKCSISQPKLVLFSRYLSFYLDFLVM